MTLKQIKQDIHDKQFVKVKIAYSFSVEPEAYVRLQEIKYGFDADGNEYLSNNEIKAAINSMSGLTTKNADSGAGMNAMGDDESFQQAFLNQLLGRG